MVIVWDHNMKTTNKINLKELRFYNPKIVSIAENLQGKIAVGTRSSEIAEIAPNKPKTVLKGHWDGMIY
jgi:hypothetical protein